MSTREQHLLKQRMTASRNDHIVTFGEVFKNSLTSWNSFNVSFAILDPSQENYFMFNFLMYFFVVCLKAVTSIQSHTCSCVNQQISNVQLAIIHSPVQCCSIFRPDSSTPEVIQILAFSFKPSFNDSFLSFLNSL